MAALEEKTSNYQEHMSDHIEALMRIALLNHRYIATHLCFHHDMEELCGQAEVVEKAMNCMKEKGMVKECQPHFE